jgi:hypothetical protein
LDVEEVMAYADGFVRAVATEKKELIARYVSEEYEAKVVEVLDALPRPIETTEVLQVTVLESGESVSVTHFSGPREEVRMRIVWIEDGEQMPVIRDARILGRASR